MVCKYFNNLYIYYIPLLNKYLNIGEEILGSDKSGREVDVPILDLFKSSGYIVLYGDSNCLDNNHIEIGNYLIYFLKTHNLYSHNYFNRLLLDVGCYHGIYIYW